MESHHINNITGVLTGFTPVLGGFPFDTFKRKKINIEYTGDYL